jgi:hypothetical protein
MEMGIEVWKWAPTLSCVQFHFPLGLVWFLVWFSEWQPWKGRGKEGKSKQTLVK